MTGAVSWGRRAAETKAYFQYIGDRVERPWAPFALNAAVVDTGEKWRFVREEGLQNEEEKVGSRRNSSNKNAVFPECSSLLLWVCIE
jgi:hypothetical protein